jgi:hypothetical protein
MTIKAVLTKILAILGSALIGLIMLAPVVIAVIRFIQMGRLHLDYLLPAELFPGILAGSLLLVVVAFWTRLRRKIIGWGLVASVILPVAGAGLASVTGLASGETEINTWQGVLLIGVFVLFYLAVVVVGIGGVLLVSDLFKAGRKPA